jgi:hypothetical protein
MDSVTTEPTNNNNNHFPLEETPSLSGRSDTGSSSSSSSSSTTSEFISNTDLVATTNDLTEPDAKKLKRSVNTTGKITTKDKSKTSNFKCIYEIFCINQL